MQILNMFRSKSKNQIAESKLRSYVDYIKFILVNVGCTVPFYIMGGCVYSTLKGLDLYDDIDVFFNNSKDAEAVIAAVEAVIAAVEAKMAADTNFSFSLGAVSTLNALSFTWPEAPSPTNVSIGDIKKIQLIRKTFGTVDEIFDSFDLNASMCCITSEYDILTNVRLDEDIKINFKNFRSNTIKRYFKYIDEKKCIDEGATQIFNIIDYLIDNFFANFDALYGKYNVLGHELMFEIFDANLLSNTFETQKYIFNKMCKKFEKEELIQAFIALNFIFNTDITCSCLEYAVFDLVNKSNIVTPENIKLAHETYPEYFI